MVPRKLRQGKNRWQALTAFFAQKQRHVTELSINLCYSIRMLQCFSPVVCSNSVPSRNPSCSHCALRLAHYDNCDTPQGRPPAFSVRWA